jgi:hypothetical protein
MLNGEECGRRRLGLTTKRSRRFAECVAMPSVKGQEFDERRLNKLGDTKMLLIFSREEPNSNTAEYATTNDATTNSLYQ